MAALQGGKDGEQCSTDAQGNPEHFETRAMRLAGFFYYTSEGLRGLASECLRLCGPH